MVGRAVVSATQRRATPKVGRRNVLEYHAPEVVAILATGEQPAEVARIYGVERSSVSRFLERHADDVNSMRAEVIKQVEDYAIAQKVHRIATLQRLADDVTAYLDDRGLIERSTMTTKDGTTIERERFAREISAELRAILKDAADEMGQLPQRAGDTYNIDKAIIVREYGGGFDPAAIE
jgi:ParB-like chromosome segregation protein Spo0J